MFRYLLAIVLLFSWGAASAQNEQDRFVVEQLIGKEFWVHHQNVAEKQALEKGNVLHVGDTVETGDSSHVVISILDGSKISIGPFTQYQLLKVEGDQSFWQWSFRLIIGTVRALVRKVDGQSDLTKFKVHTESGTVGVRGTDFVVAFSQNNSRTDVYTLEGKVYLGPPNTEFSHPSSALVEKNRMRSIGKDGKPTKHKAFIREEFLKRLKDNGFPDLELGTDLSVAGGSGVGLKPSAGAPNTPAAIHSAPTGKGEKAEENISQKMIAAAAAGDTANVKKYLKEGADPNFQDSYGFSGLMYAAKSGNTLCIKALIDQKADPNLQDNEGNTALMHAVSSGDLQGVVLMRAANATLNLKNKKRKTVLDFAKTRKDKDISEYLNIWQKEINSKK